MIAVKSNYFLFIFIFVTSCTTYYKHTITPISENKFWHQGIECAYISEEDIEIVLYFNNVAENCMYFYLTVTNYDTSSILIEPGKITCFYHNDLETTAINENISYVVDPEQRINRIDNEIVKEEKDHEAKSAICCILMGFSVIADIADAFSNSEEEEYVDDDEGGSTVCATIDLYVDENQNHNEKISSLNSEKNFYSAETLRKTTLFQDESVEGLMILPRNDQKKYLTVNIPIKSSIYQFKFHQVIKEL